MGKRSSFERKKNDFYATPEKPVLPLLPHLLKNTKFIEPCVGEGDLVNHLTKFGHECVGRYDLPTDATVTSYDLGNEEYCAEYFITNPPWTRQLLHPMIDNLRMQLPTWLLFDAGWMHTKQAQPFLPFCSKIVSVGRVKWIAGSLYGSLDDACWYLFGDQKVDTKFFGLT